MNPKRESGASNGKKGSFVVRTNYRNLDHRRWDDVPADVVTDLISTVTNASAAIMLGRTSDGGALSLCILDGDQKIKEYFRDYEDLESFLGWLKDEVFPQSAGSMALVK